MAVIVGTILRVQACDLPLLLASERFAVADENEPLDRLRIQKGVFLLEMRGPSAWNDLYQFVPYDWGPYSRQLASDVSSLVAADLLEQESVRGRRYRAYRTTPLGEREIETSVAAMPANHREFITQVRRFVTARSFTQLLRDVYAEYPSYAVASRFRG